MANEIQYEHYNNTDTIYALIRNAAGEVLRTGDLTFVTYPASGSLSNYAIGSAQPDNGFLWRCNFPEGLLSDSYIIQIKRMNGISPNYDDLIIGSSQSYWNGNVLSEVNLEAIITNNSDNLDTIVGNENDNKDLIIADNGTNTEAILTAINNLSLTPSEEINIEVGHSTINVETGVR